MQWEIKCMPHLFYKCSWDGFTSQNSDTHKKTFKRYITALNNRLLAIIFIVRQLYLLLFSTGWQFTGCVYLHAFLQVSCQTLINILTLLFLFSSFASCSILMQKTTILFPCSQFEGIHTPSYLCYTLCVCVWVRVRRYNFKRHWTEAVTFVPQRPCSLLHTRTHAHAYQPILHLYDQLHDSERLPRWCWR